ncbi:lipopolysaccharide biosynthesis protein [Shewanella gelidii]|uniref:Lipopolysaccharide biosynthesis protein n=2 Tax=Shewanella gelidii TaxID=1642821 RepID=A0A917N5M0_9GAMM|nr:lipopolysaccharide biosynthesis protein [Shewanella gelidii]
MSRIVRLGSSVILARLLVPEVFGQVAIILTCFELICTPTRRISSAPLIAMSEHQYSQHLAAANRVNWIACIVAFLLMSLITWVVASYNATPSLIAPMLCMALSYLLLPFGMQYATQNLRANKMRVVGRAALWQTIVESVLSASLALAGVGIWAIVLPKLLVVSVWIMIHRHQNPLPNYKASQATLNQTKKLLQFGLQVGFSDFSISLRQNIDYLIVGYFLGVEALGVYFFAVNASLGISLGVSQSFGTAFYSLLCKQKDQRQSEQDSASHHPPAKSINREKLIQFKQSTSIISLLTIPIVLLQAGLAPFYVPYIYGTQWVDAGALPVFVMLCLSGMVRPMGEAAGQLLISEGKSHINLAINISFTCLLAITIALACQVSLLTVAQSIFVLYSICMPLICLYSYQNVRQENFKRLPIQFVALNQSNPSRSLR